MNPELEKAVRRFPGELTLKSIRRGWRLTIMAPDLRGSVETGSRDGMIQIIAAYAKFREAQP